MSIFEPKTGACLVYTPEDGMNLDTLRRDVRFLKTRYALDVKGKSEGRLVIRYDICFLLKCAHLKGQVQQERAGLFGIHD